MEKEIEKDVRILEEKKQAPKQDIYKDMDEWAKKEKGYDTYAEWYLDHMD